MTYKELDFIFPFIVLFYGATMCLLLSSTTLMKLAEERLPYPMVQQLNAHRTLGIVCLVVGSLWSLQNLW